MSSRSTASSGQDASFKAFSETFPSKLRDSNYTFLKHQHRQQQKLIQSSKSQPKTLSRSIDKIKSKLQSLSDEQVELWRDALLCKCRQLYKARKFGPLKQTLKILTYVCKELSTSYDRKAIQQIIKEVYYEEQGEQVVKEFSRAGYDVSEYQTLVFEESVFGKILSFFENILD